MEMLVLLSFLENDYLHARHTSVFLQIILPNFSSGTTFVCEVCGAYKRRSLVYEYALTYVYVLVPKHTALWLL